MELYVDADEMFPWMLYRREPEPGIRTKVEIECTESDLDNYQEALTIVMAFQDTLEAAWKVAE